MFIMASVTSAMSHVDAPAEAVDAPTETIDRGGAAAAIQSSYCPSQYRFCSTIKLPLGWECTICFCFSEDYDEITHVWAECGPS